MGRGFASGVLAGVAFAALNSWFATTTGKPALAPFRVIATLAQGPPPSQATVWIGMVIHSLLSALLGLVFGVLLAALLAAGFNRAANGADLIRGSSTCVTTASVAPSRNVGIRSWVWIVQQ
ncbi:hypothetical protein [Haloactinomyces albus]|uniref:Uncharacterized protein n=1 Tax=Haloactinomyces albus TaxID=1352928 RepID=A0AAE3ZE38_9ACTN|nr:hypothetical protein [Haloactinomyces albus]MDR7302135.1 hypothetical protein [Haloactinomyces albus]